MESIQRPRLALYGVTSKVLLIWALLLSCAYLAFRLMEPRAPVAPPQYSRVLGARLFYRYECGRCHSLSRLPGAEGKMGPPLDHVGSLAGGRKKGMTAHDYLMESLVEPQAFVVEGYMRTMPSFAHLERPELDELVAYLESLK